MSCNNRAAIRASVLTTGGATAQLRFVRLVLVVAYASTGGGRGMNSGVGPEAEQSADNELLGVIGWRIAAAEVAPMFLKLSRSFNR